MAHVLLLHSVRGLRSVEREIAGRWKAEGHDVEVPDFFEGEVPGTVERGFAVVEATGEPVLVERAAAAAAAMPPETVLAGLSMGAGIAAMLWERRPEAAAVLMLHGVGPVPRTARAGTPAQLHLAEPDEFETEEWVDAWREEAAARRLAAEVFRYPGAGHLFTDATIDEYEPESAALLLSRASGFLAEL